MPERYPIFILATNNYHTTWFKIEEDNLNMLQILDELIDTKEWSSDHEEEFKTRGQGGMVRSGSGEDWNKEREHEFKEHLKKVMEKTKYLWNKEKYQTFFLVSPEIIKNSMKKELTPLISSKEINYIPGNFLQPSLHSTLLAHIHEHVKN